MTQIGKCQLWSKWLDLQSPKDIGFSAKFAMILVNVRERKSRCMGRSVAIIGVAGFIGSNLACELLQRGWHVTGLDCFSQYYAKKIKLDNLESIAQHNNFKFFEKELLPDTLHEVIKVLPSVDAVIDAAALPGVRYSLKNANQVLKWNGNTASASARLARLAGATHYVYLSSSSVYGQGELPYSEATSLCSPLSPYAMSKVEAENAIAEVFAGTNVNRWILRLFSVYGPNLRPDLALAKFASQIARGEPISVYGSLDMSRDFTYVSDVARAVSLALERDSVETEILNISRGEDILLRHVIVGLEEIIGRKAQIRLLPKNEYEPHNTLGNPEKASVRLGFRAEVPFPQGLILTTPWLKKTMDVK